MNTQIQGAMTTAGIVCPHCWKPLTFFALTTDPVPGTILTRNYSGWCTRMSCGHGVIAEQFFDGEVWKMHRFQIFQVDRGSDDGRLMHSGWIVVNAIPGLGPATPLVVTGPGGDYQEAVHVSGESLMATLIKILSQAKDAVEAMLPLWRVKEPNPQDPHHEDNC